MPFAHVKDLKLHYGSSEEYVRNLPFCDYLVGQFQQGQESGHLESLNALIIGHIRLQAQLIDLLLKKNIINIEELKFVLDDDKLLAINDDWEYELPKDSNK